ncbi:thioredoxin family protein [Aliidongia dinghuensis]|uniref:Thioredoxin family protein n=1 Tax=Aliidongia dinghuensis TaxID=1867774 RepID=A0A8J2YWB2_9PROT|nr:thioredoxin family protein [Aliidongia dinghuensis]GGF31289.1 thioredoxin family protein [Aliidongia dinghuensis]
MLALGLSMIAGAVILGTEDGAAAGNVASVAIGAPAPDFSARDTKGALVHLSDYRGRVVVLEWTNDACPFVAKHYRSGNMQALQRTYTGEGVVWLTVASSAEGEPGYVTPAEADRDTAARDAAPTAVLLDPGGTVGRLYGARATPHMFVIDKAGQLVYRGAIDDMPSTNPADVAIAHNYVKAALDETLAGRPVAVSATTAYGCSVKYAPRS